MGAALAARTRDQLRALTADLPGADVRPARPATALDPCLLRLLLFLCPPAGVTYWLLSRRGMGGGWLSRRWLAEYLPNWRDADHRRGGGRRRPQMSTGGGPVPARPAAAKAWHGVHKALADPLRIRLWEWLAESPRSARQLADCAGLPADRLYYHLGQLEQAGLIEVAEYRPLARGKVERVYAPARSRAARRRRRPQETAAFLGSMLEATAMDITAAYQARQAGRRREVDLTAAPCGSPTRRWPNCAAISSRSPPGTPNPTPMEPGRGWSWCWPTCKTAPPRQPRRAAPHEQHSGRLPGGSSDVSGDDVGGLLWWSRICVRGGFLHVAQRRPGVQTAVMNACRSMWSPIGLVNPARRAIRGRCPAQHAVDHYINGEAKPFVDISSDQLSGVGSNERKVAGRQAGEVGRDFGSQCAGVGAPQLGLDGGVRHLGREDVGRPRGVLSVEAASKQDSQEVLQ